MENVVEVYISLFPISSVDAFYRYCSPEVCFLSRGYVLSCVSCELGLYRVDMHDSRWTRPFDERQQYVG